ncbi:hypothetical protein [Caballeronia sp. ATUFL_M2_KS44]|uniref:hypothetical protein n=1 Tax=Caballeronia sp. ATUFL_M2_KS44 TaxID=2921767 RepID=UPI002028AC8F|nr:hypothetical protein [Caballeronia sp. ATUFL_M2_KS44]
MMQSEYSLSLDAVICRRCNAVSPAVNDTCPSCGADRQGAIFTSVTVQDAAAAPVEDPRDFVDLRDTGWLTRLARRKMVTSYPSLVEPGDALASPERKPARKGLAVLVGGVVAGIAAGGYFYAQMDTASAPPPSVTVAGAIGNGASMPRDHGDADRPALDRRRSDDAAAQADRRGGLLVASASASAGTAVTRPASMPATAAIVTAAPPVPSSKPIAEIRVPAMANESPKTRDASRRAVADAIDLAAKRDAAPPNTATGAVVSQSASGVAPQSAQSAASVASARPASGGGRAMANATMADATPATSTLAGSASSATGGAHAASPLASSGTATKTVTASTPPTAASATVPTLANRSTIIASQTVPAVQATAPTQTASRATSAATADSSPAAPKSANPPTQTASRATIPATAESLPAAPKSANPPTQTASRATSAANADSSPAAPKSANPPTQIASRASIPATAGSPPAAPKIVMKDAPKPTTTAAPQTVARADQPTQERPRKPDTDKSAAAPTQEAPSPAEARTIAAVQQALATRDLATARRHLRVLTATQSRSPQTQQLAADVSRQERARDSAMASARSCAANHEPACAVRNARRAVALDPRNAQAQATLKHAMTVQADANTAYFRQASALPAPAVPSMTFDGRWSVAGKSASASGGRSDASGAYTLFGWGVPTVSKGRGDAH